MIFLLTKIHLEIYNTKTRCIMSERAPGYTISPINRSSIMSFPTYPQYLFPRPFADNGTYQVIPDSKAVEGRASFKEGFPTETQLPLSNGGIAPNRTDFNGILHMLSAMAFWQQNGGPAVYNTSLDYNTPAIVFHNGGLWYCTTANGPGQICGTIPPGTDTGYWVTFLEFLASGTGGESGTSLAVPVGAVIAFWGTIAPDGYFFMDGSAFDPDRFPKLAGVLGSATLPDMRGLFARGYDPAGVNDPDGATRALGIRQNDAIRNITGSFSGKTGYGAGAFYNGEISEAAGTGRTYWYRAVHFDVSRVVPTASENRPKNINVLYCIKHD